MESTTYGSSSATQPQHDVSLNVKQPFDKEQSLTIIEEHEQLEPGRTSIHRGVSRHPGTGKWIMTLYVSGYYDCEEEAARAHDSVVRHFVDEVGGEKKVAAPVVGY
jgi:hypothetical protein